jgi:hypothetical protein
MERRRSRLHNNLSMVQEGELPVVVIPPSNRRPVNLATMEEKISPWSIIP